MPVFPVLTLPDSDGVFPFSASDCHHLKVLRLQPGAKITVSFPDGRQGEAQIQESTQGWQGKILQAIKEVAVREYHLWVGCGIIRPQRMDGLIEKLTEMNLWRFTPLYTEFSRHSLQQPYSAHRLARLQKLAQESLKQCERFRTPEIYPPTTFQEWLLSTQSLSGKKIILQARSHSHSLANLVLDPKLHHALLIGPEGGFSPNEMNTIDKHGFMRTSLGTGIYRTETAVLMACTLLQNPRGLA